MDSGYYAACAGLKAQTQALEIVANNLANLQTTGYRGEQPTFRALLASSGTEAMLPLNRVVNDFGILAGTRVDLSPGNLERTGNPLDLAIEGSGFFAVQTKAGVLYTRNGNFQVSSQGQLVTVSGDLVMGDQGPITVPRGAVSISADGTISVDGAVAGKLKLVEFARGSSPVPESTSYFSVPNDQVKPAPDSYVRQNMLEASNVNAVTAVVSLITVQRQAEMLERAMSVFHSDLNHIAANDLPKV